MDVLLLASGGADNLLLTTGDDLLLTTATGVADVPGSATLTHSGPTAELSHV